jgi:hypothetical protein
VTCVLPSWLLCCRWALTSFSASPLSMEHMVRACVIALRLAEQLGLDESQRTVVYYSGLLAWVGCHTYAYEQAKWLGDDLAWPIRAPSCAPRRLVVYPRGSSVCGASAAFGTARYGTVMTVLSLVRDKTRFCVPPGAIGLGMAGNRWARSFGLG